MSKETPFHPLFFLPWTSERYLHQHSMPFLSDFCYWTALKKHVLAVITGFPQGPFKIDQRKRAALGCLSAILCPFHGTGATPGTQRGRWKHLSSSLIGSFKDGDSFSMHLYRHRYFQVVTARLNGVSHFPSSRASSVEPPKLLSSSTSSLHTLSTPKDSYKRDSAGTIFPFKSLFFSLMKSFVG